jgi:hypothetical protein
MKGFSKLVVACLAFSVAILGARYFAFDESPGQAVRGMLRAVKGDTTSAPAADGYADTASTEYASPAVQAGRELALRPPGGRELRVFFIGNSLTFYNDMPKMVERLAWADGVNLHAEQHAPGGATLNDHESSPEVSRQLARGGWDFVVLQEQSQLPAFSDEQVRNDMFPPAQGLARMARAASPGVQIVVYSTPAHKDGNPGLEANYPGIGTYDGMQRRSIRTYEALAPTVNAVIAPAGVAWMRARAADPSADFYRDDRHPSVEGSYLIACVFYATLTGRTAVGNRYTAGLDSATAAWLQQMAR